MIWVLTTKSYAAPVPNRLAGSDRYKTAVEIAKSGWQSSDNIVLTTGEKFPDALCAAPLAKQLNAPILLTGKTALNGDTDTEISRLGAKNVFIIGGEGVISNTVRNRLEEKGIKVTRLWGSDRYETSYEVAKYMASNFSINNEMAVATGESFPDALSISSIAAQKNMIILLVPEKNIYGNMSENIKSLVNNHGITKTYIVGGSSIISNTVASLFPAPERIEGADGYERNIAVLNRFKDDIKYDKVYIATGEDYPDALAGSSLAPLTSSPIILTGKNPGKSTWSHVNSMLSYIKEVKVLGGSGAVSETAIESILANSFGAGEVQTKEPSNKDGSGIKLATGYAHTLVVTDDGTLWTFGYNYSGQLGKGTEQPYNNPLPIKIMTEVKDIAAGSLHSLAVKKDGSLWAWGYNHYGQVGNYTTDSIKDVLSPVKIMDDVTAVAAGGNHSLAIKNDGTLWAWGANEKGQLGDGTVEYKKAKPVKIMDDVKDIAAGSEHSLALKNDGSLWAWGSNWGGQVGDGTKNDTSVPVQIMSDVKAVAAGPEARYSFAIKNDGTLWLWGYNIYGSRNGIDIYHTKPVQVMKDVKEVYGGFNHTVAIKTDGTLWGWGSDSAGQLGGAGSGSKGTVAAPVKIMTDVTDAAAGKYFTIIAKTDGTLWGVGFNHYGDLGNGSLKSTNTFTQVKME